MSAGRFRQACPNSPRLALPTSMYLEDPKPCTPGIHERGQGTRGTPLSELPHLSPSPGDLVFNLQETESLFLLQLCKEFLGAVGSGQSLYLLPPDSCSHPHKCRGCEQEWPQRLPAPWLGDGVPVDFVSRCLETGGSGPVRI